LLPEARSAEKAGSVEARSEDEVAEDEVQYSGLGENRLIMRGGGATCRIARSASDLLPIHKNTYMSGWLPTGQDSLINPVTVGKGIQSEDT